MRALGCSALILCLCTAAAPLGAATFPVDDVGDAPDADTSDGLCATTGDVCTLRAALEQANALAGEAHTITLPAGVYAPATSYPSITQDVTVNGAGASTTSIQSAGPRLFDVPAGGALALHDVTLTGAGAPGGSALRASGGGVTLADCAIVANTGGAVVAAAPSPLGSPATIAVTNATFSGNTGGSALEVGTSYSLVLAGANFMDNHQATDGFGGAIAITGGGAGRSQSITGVNFYGNSAAGGGALSILNVSGTVAVSLADFDGNTATIGSSAGYGGGAVLSFKPGVAIAKSRFADNHANGSSYNGGAILSPQTAFSCTGCAFSGNTASGTGGGICATGITLVNSTFYGNTAGTSGGAVYVDNPSLVNALRAANVTVVANNAAAGGGIRGGSASVVIKNSLLAANSAPTGPDCVGTITSQGYNLVGDGSACDLTPTTGDRVGTAATPIDAHLDEFGNYGGVNDTVGLLPGSPAIDGGNPAGCTDFAATPLTTDQRDSARPTDGDGDLVAVCDAGAFEAPTVPPATTSSTVPGATTSTTTTSVGPTTSTTIPAAVCDGGVAIDHALLVVKRVAAPPGDEALVFRGVLAVPAGTPAVFDPAGSGAQLLLEDLGGGGGAIFELSHRTHPVPAGGGCGRDGWKRSRYGNASGSIDPPACTPGSANGLRSLRLKDRRAKGKGIAFAVVTKRSHLGTPVGPFRGTVVLGASATSSRVGDCGVRTFAAGECRAKGTTIRCR